MAKIHDKYVIELAEVIKGYGNNPDVADPFRLSEFYRFYELPNIAVSQENFEKMQLLEDVPFGYSQEYINQIKWERDLAIQQLNELGYGLGEEMRTDGDTISRRAAINLIGQHTFYNDYDDMDRCSLVDGLRKLPSAQPTQSNDSNTLNALDCVSRQAVRDWLVNNWDGRTKTIFGDWIENLPSAQPEISRIEQELHGKTPEEQYEFIDWLMFKFALAYTDSRLAVVEWLRGEKEDE